MKPDLTVENVVFTVILLTMPIVVFAVAVLIDHLIHGTNREDHNQ